MAEIARGMVGDALAAFVSRNPTNARMVCQRDEKVDNLRRSVVEDLKKYVRMARSGGMYAEYWYSLGTDAIDEVERLCEQVVARFPRAVFFAGKLVFQEENVLTRLLHNQAAQTLQRRLQFKGLQMVVLPVRAM